MMLIVLQVTLTNKDQTMLHNLDFHSVSGPGGGAPLLTVEPGETKQAWFKLLHPGTADVRGPDLVYSSITCT